MSKILLEKCSICDKTEWKSLDHLRNAKYWYEKDYIDESETIGFKICINCGYTTYNLMTDERIKQIYEDCRPVMRQDNIITSNRKNEYHKLFLKDINKYLKKDIKDCKILDVGCAQGSFLNLLHTNFYVPKENLFGNETNKAFRNYCRFEYEIECNNKPMDQQNQKFDIISYYHVLEHIQQPEKELKNAIAQLTENGLLYISVPLWFDELEESSGAMIVKNNESDPFEEYYHLNHCNVFSIQSFTNLLNKFNLEILKLDTIMYCYTILCRPRKDKKVEFLLQKEDYKEIEKILETQKKVIELLAQNKFDEIIQIYPKYPDCYLVQAAQKDIIKNIDKIKDIFDNALKIMPNNIKLLMQYAYCLLQWDERTPEKRIYISNNIKKVEEIAKYFEINKPGSEECFFWLGLINLNYHKDYDLAVKYFRRVLEINPLRMGEINNFIALCWNEKGLNEVKDK